MAEYYPKFRDRRAAEERPLPRYVEDEFEAYLKCGRLEHGFLRVRCESCQAEKLVAFSCKRRGFCPSCGGRLRVIASIEEPAVIERILGHLGRAGESVDPAHPSRAPPQGDLLV